MTELVIDNRLHCTLDRMELEIGKPPIVILPRITHLVGNLHLIKWRIRRIMGRPAEGLGTWLLLKVGLDFFSGIDRSFLLRQLGGKNSVQFSKCSRQIQRHLIFYIFGGGRPKYRRIRRLAGRLSRPLLKKKIFWYYLVSNRGKDL